MLRAEGAAEGSDAVPPDRDQGVHTGGLVPQLYRYLPRSAKPRHNVISPGLTLPFAYAYRARTRRLHFNKAGLAPSTRLSSASSSASSPRFTIDSSDVARSVLLDSLDGIGPAVTIEEGDLPLCQLIRVMEDQCEGLAPMP